MTYFHSVTLDKEKCKGCTNCIKRCPTEAIRVRGGKAKIIKERCIDCGECIRVCPYHAKLAVTDDFGLLEKYKYRIAIPAPALYGQFRNYPPVNLLLSGLRKIGFDDVFEVARGAEYISAATRALMQEGKLPKPAISSACPAVVRLIRVRFPNLIENVIDLLAPMETAAMLARKRAKKTGYSDEEIGVFFITPCPAKMTAIKSPIGIEKSYVSGAIAVKDVYARLLPMLKDIKEEEILAQAGPEGVLWARNGGEGEGTGLLSRISVDGIDNVIKILEEIEDDRLEDVDFVELSACLGGCVGGVLNVENPFVSSTRIKALSRRMEDAVPTAMPPAEMLQWETPMTYQPIMTLDENFSAAMQKMAEMERIYEGMPKLDCGSCGAPSCRALAEDIVRGFGNINDCIFIMRERVRELAEELFDLEVSSHTRRKEDCEEEKI